MLFRSSGCRNLIDLRLKELKLVPPDINQVISRSKIPTPVSLYIDESTFGFTAFLNSATPQADGPLVDFSLLQRAKFDVESRDNIGQLIELIKVTTRLESLSINTLVDCE